ncbi:MAG: diguanylate cyclase, partial [Halothiobacillaceae bacterium]|nr:diguanylate cyclase [Halothiobacillaceae bacterium]
EVRTVDNVARFRGEEFVVLLREANLGDAFLLAERPRQQISAQPRWRRRGASPPGVRDSAR